MILYKFELVFVILDYRKDAEDILGLAQKIIDALDAAKLAQDAADVAITDADVRLSLILKAWG